MPASAPAGSSPSWRVELRRRELRLCKGDGTSTSFVLAGVGDIVVGEGGWLCVRRNAHAVDVQEPGGRRYSFAADKETSNPRAILPLLAISDAFGNTIRLEYSQRRLVRVIDSVGREVRVRWTRAQRLSALEVHDASNGSWLTSIDGAPEWVGGQAANASVKRSYRYNGESEPVEIRDSRLEDAVITHDASGQVTTVCRGQALRDFSYDASGNLYETGATAARRSYQPGNKLERIGKRRYVWSDDADLAEIREDGAVGEERVTALSWDACGRLRGVSLPDGRSVSFTYDPWARRASKTTTLPDGAIEHTRYVWHGEALAHEIRRRSDRAGNHIVAERSYVFDDGATRPIAHCDHRNGAEDWLFYVTDEQGTPCHLVRDDGSLAASPVIDVWGEPLSPEGGAATRLRFRGQYADEETGLYYNRYRYYAPDAGRYISPDPLGVLVGTNAFAYADNCPTTLLDPYGLMPLSVITQPGREDITGRSGEVPQRDNNDPRFNPAVGAAHENALAHGAGTNASCAEIAALHAMGNQVRDDLEREGRGTSERGRVTRADVRNEMRERFRNGARIRTNNGGRGQGEAMCPCPVCSQTMRELGIHPENINAEGEEPAVGGVEAPNPGRPRNRGLWDGQSEWVHNGNNPPRAPTQPSTTTPVSEWDQ